MALPIAAGLGLRGLMGLLGRGAAARSSGQSAMGRLLGNKKIMPFAGKKPGSAGAITADINLTRDAARRAAVEKLIAAEKRKALLTALGVGAVGGVATGGLTQLLLNQGAEDEMDVRRPSLMGIDEPDLTVEDLVMRGGTNEPVRSGADNEGFVSRSDMMFDDQGNFIKPQDRMPDTGEIDLLKLLGIR